MPRGETEGIDPSDEDFPLKIPKCVPAMSIPTACLLTYIVQFVGVTSVLLKYKVLYTH